MDRVIKYIILPNGSYLHQLYLECFITHRNITIGEILIVTRKYKSFWGGYGKVSINGAHTIDISLSYLGRSRIQFHIANIYLLIRLLVIIIRFRPKHLVFGNYNNVVYRWLIKLLSFRMEIVFFDEGIGSLFMYESRKDFLRKASSSLYLRTKNLLFFNNHPLRRVTFFSRFLNENNGFDNIESFQFSMNLNNKSIGFEDRLLIIGGAYIRSGWLSNENFIKLIQLLKDEFPTKATTYIRHPREQDISLILDDSFDYLDLNEAIEKYLIELDYLPNYICSLTSTSLRIIKDIYGDRINIYFIDVKEDFIKNSRRKEYIMIRDFYRGQSDIIKLRINEG
jgi:hypothetical protein